MNDQFAQDVIKGLSDTPKQLPSKYFYDEKGDKLFQKIMALDEYYLTNSEYEILDTYKSQLLSLFGSDVGKFNLVEFGAGDGYKTKVLLKHFLEKEARFKYVPIDISGNVLNILENSLKKELPDLKVEGIENDYFRALQQLENNGTRNVVLFLGSNIGNFTGDQAFNFLKGLYDGLHRGDMVMIGFDLKKDPSVILKAYDDSEGVTRAFNFNLLDRINKELGANFDLDKFRHFPSYNPQTGTTESYLISTERQQVELQGQVIDFDPWESIHMEISQKYGMRDVSNLALQAGFTIAQNFYDKNSYYVDSVWRK
ncbi:L-histidine N(alpha)-methyltransferase [Fulvivirga sp. RKSG066]|uniref:L-histidine N(alpha)-methyltransferase n=1 Tax=Fulvivirga aurantia TaxID=2529383 RepID=UPI0012BC33CF|nr:L-histidine N(alpha)-methyltransferase [Fulvivirga aurantia]MTI22589.1 L-histidine N(alpha)-methyltransferase [Fulvivirga aurantia]